jgi:hypothetical protein
VCEHKVASNTATGGYLKKATFAYNADSMPNAMDNQVNDKFDRTFKYDSVGRMVANQFGNPLSNEIPYVQYNTYDTFSQMTNRYTSHWSSQNSYNAAFINGRKQAIVYQTIVYDAAGNMLDSGGNAANNSWQKTTVEASGRTNSTKTRYRELRGTRLPTFWIMENEVEQI